MNNKESSKQKQAFIEKSQRLGGLLLWAATSIVAKSAIIITAIAIGGWLLYAHSWQPLRSEAQFPEGMLPSDPAVDTHIIQQINAQRSFRTNYAGKNFNTLTGIFSP